MGLLYPRKQKKISLKKKRTQKGRQKGRQKRFMCVIKPIKKIFLNKFPTFMLMVQVFF